MKMHLSCLITCLLLLGAIAQPVGGQQDARQSISLEEIKVRIGKLGIGEKAKATITLKDGRKVKGYLYQTGDDDFIIRDRKTDAPTMERRPTLFASYSSSTSFVLARPHYSAST
jgi:hypothetical protein